MLKTLRCENTCWSGTRVFAQRTRATRREEKFTRSQADCTRCACNRVHVQCTMYMYSRYYRKERWKNTCLGRRAVSTVWSILRLSKKRPEVLVSVRSNSNKLVTFHLVKTWRETERGGERKGEAKKKNERTHRKFIRSKPSQSDFATGTIIGFCHFEFRKSWPCTWTTGRFAPVWFDSSKSTLPVPSGRV